MKRSEIIFILYFIVTGSALSQDSVNLVIKTNDENAIIFLDDEYVGSHNLEAILDPGEYYVLVTQRNRGWNAEKFSETIQINDTTKLIELEYKFVSKVYLNSTPQDAEVYFNDSLITFTPALVQPTFNPLLLTKNNFNPVKISLSDIPETNPVKLDFSGIKKKEQFVDSPWFSVLIGSAVVFGATAAYFKIQADQKFDKYTTTHDSTILDEVDRYDLYSGIAFGILQVNFGYLIYEFIFMD